jgi:hypothetical protein
MGVNSRAHVFNVALPSAGTNLLPENLKPLFDNAEFRIHATLSKAGKLSMVRVHRGVTITEELNNGTNLGADVGYTFVVPTRFFTEYNLRYSVTNGTISVIQIEEISP